TSRTRPMKMTISVSGKLPQSAEGGSAAPARRLADRVARAGPAADPGADAPDPLASATRGAGRAGAPGPRSRRRLRRCRFVAIEIQGAEAPRLRDNRRRS